MARAAAPKGRSRAVASKTATPARTYVSEVMVTATEAKNSFGPLLEKAIQGGAVVITKHHRPKAVLLSVAQYDALMRGGQPALGALTEEFDQLLDRMQSAASRRGLEASFQASPERLGAMAVAHAKRRG